MRTIKTIHRDAMEQTDLALAARRQGDEAAASSYFRRAYELELEAASSFIDRPNDEPTRSILYRSAATLALDCNLTTEAEKLICTALVGNPPDVIAEELRDLLEQVHFHRHLALRGMELRANEVQMSIAGREVGYGIAPMDSFLKRIQNTASLLFRTAERKRNLPYRDSGRIGRSISENLQFFLTVPRPASFAVTFRLGETQQLNLPGFSIGEEVIDEVLDCLELYRGGNEQDLRKRITEDSYYRNFVSLAENISPDGNKVRLVGFTTIRKGSTKAVALTRPTLEAPAVRARDVTTVRGQTETEADAVEVRGLLRFANSLKKTDEIQIVSGGAVRHTVVVPEGMMSDIVKPLWDSEVVITGVQKGKRILLMQIRAAEPE
jgi:hypothetical protein